MKRATVIASCPAILLTAPAADAASMAERDVNRGVVEIETMGTRGVLVRMGEDLAALIDDGATRRVLPVVGMPLPRRCPWWAYYRSGGWRSCWGSSDLCRKFVL